MSSLSQEASYVQNPALGASLLWRFSTTYVEHHRFSSPVPLPLLFIVLPIIFHEQTNSFVKRTQKASGLRAFAGKFGDVKESKQDILLALHLRMLRLRSLSAESLQMAISARLLHLLSDATLSPLAKAKGVTELPTEAKQLLVDAEKLGTWCAPLTLHEIATILKVRF
jgi:Family of unknown function (DUF6521)